MSKPTFKITRSIRSQQVLDTFMDRVLKNNQPVGLHGWSVYGKLGAMGRMALFLPGDWHAHIGNIGNAKKQLTFPQKVLICRQAIY